MSKRETARTALLVAMLVLAGASSAVATTAATTDPGVSVSEQQDEPTITNESADDAYVTSDGKTVLVYHEDPEDESGTGQVSLDVSQGLLYVMFSEARNESGGTGEMALSMTPQSVAGNGSFSVDKPDDLSSLAMDAQLDQDATDASASLTLDSAFASEGTTGASMLESMQTTGEFSMTGSALQTSGSASATGNLQTVPNQHHELTLEENETGYELTVSQDYPVTTPEQWNTRSNAQQTLNEQFCSVGSQIGDECTVSISEYAFDDAANQSRLDIEYTMTVTGVDEFLSQMIGLQLAQSEQFNLTQEEQTQVAESITELQVRTATVTADVADDGAEVTWDATLENYGPALKAWITLSQSMSDSPYTADQTERIEKGFEAMQASDLEQRYTWDASLDASQANQFGLDATLEYTTKNWATYVTELENSGIDQGEAHLTASLETSDGQLVADADGEFTHPDLLNRSYRWMEQAIEQAESEQSSGDFDQLAQTSGSASSEYDDAKAVVTALRESQFKRGELRVTVNDSTVALEGGSVHENMSALTSVVDRELTRGSISKSHIRTNESATTTYVVLEEAVNASATESSVRELEPVSNDTTLHMPEEWNRENASFPTLPLKQANGLLGTDASGSALLADAPAETTQTSTGAPGFTVLAGLLALFVVLGTLAAKVGSRNPQSDR